MSQEDFPIDFVLESIETIMTSENQPRVILFDVGGVCVSNHSFMCYGCAAPELLKYQLRIAKWKFMRGF